MGNEADFPGEVGSVHYGGVQAEGAHDAVDVAVGKICQYEKRRKRGGAQTLRHRQDGRGGQERRMSGRLFH